MALAQQLIRPYAPTDREACLALLRSNIPEHFTEEEAQQFDAFLGQLPGPYFVIEEAPGVLVACGGVAIEPDDPETGVLCWGIVREDRQGQGLGRALTLHRLAALPGLARVRINTSQKVQGFYAKLGFAVVSVRPNGFAPGLDDVKMIRVRPA